MFAAHRRSDVAVGAVLSHCNAVHCVRARHSRLRCALAETASHSALAQMVSGEHTVSVHRWLPLLLLKPIKVVLHPNPRWRGGTTG